LSKVARVDMINTTFADYRITIENNGNQALGPVYMKDVFPTGTENITEESSNLVNWVEAAGKYSESWTLARNFSVVRLNWM
jgi:uncharacterized repeat protein (TIGR01451 family)